MATPIFVNDVLMSESICQYADLQQIAVHRHYWLAVQLTVPGVVTFGNVAAAIDTAVGSRYKAAMANNATYLGTRVRRSFPVDLKQWEVSVVHAGVGTGGATAAPGQVAGLITFLSETIGHKGEGRIYVPFPSTSAVTGDGVGSAAYLVILNALASPFASQLTAVGGTGGTMLLNPVITRQGASFGGVVPIINSRVLDSFATQKRRGAYGRFNRPPF